MEIPNWECMFVHRKQRFFLSENGRNWWNCEYWRTHIISWPCALGMHSTWMQTERNNHWTVRKDVWFTCLLLEQQRNYRDGRTSRTNGSVIPRHGGTFSQNALNDTVNWPTKVEQLYKLSHPCLDDHEFKQEEPESVGELAEVCSPIVLKCLYLGTNWTTLTSCGPWTSLRDQSRNGFRPVTTDQQSWFPMFITRRTIVNMFTWVTRLSIADWVYFQDSDFAGDLEDSKSTSRGVLCIFGSRTFVPVIWMCKKQTSVSRSSTESGIISLDAGLRMDGSLALDLWDTVIEVSTFNQPTSLSHPTTMASRKLVRGPIPKKTNIKMAGKKQNMTPMWKKLMKNVDLGEPTSSLDHENRGCTQRDFFEGIHTKDVWITYFCWSNWRVTRVGKNLTQRRLRGPATWRRCSKMCGEILRAAEQKSGAPLQSFKSLLGRKNLNQLELSQESSQIVLNCTWHELDEQTFCGLSVNLQEQSQNGLRLTTDVWQDWFRTFITQMTTDDIVMRVTQHSIADLVYSKTQTLLATLRTRDQPQVVFCEFWEVGLLSQLVGCARNKLLFRTVLQNLKLFLWMLDYVWTGYLLLILWTLWLRLYVQPKTILNPNILATRKLE